MKLSIKSAYFLRVSPFALTLWFLTPVHALEETFESRELVKQGYTIDLPNAIKLQQQSLLATSALDGVTSANTVETLPAAVTAVRGALVLETVTTVKDYVDSLATALGGSAAGIYDNAKAMNAALDGGQSMSGLTSFKVTTAAVNSGAIVNIVGNDGAAGQTYSLAYSSPIAAGETFTLANGGKSMTLVNNSGGSISSAAALAAYLSGAYPVNFTLSHNTASKISALSILLAGANGGALGTNTSVHGQALTVTASGPTNNEINGLLSAAILVTPTGVPTTDLATVAGGIVTTPSGIFENDVRTVNGLLNGTASGSTVQARLNALFAAVDGSDGSSGNVTTKLNAQITALKSGATQLSTAVSDVNSALGGSGATLARVTSVDAALLVSPTNVVTADLMTVNGLLNGTASGSTVQGRLNTLFAAVDGSDGSSGNVTTKLNAQITALKAGATQLSTAVSEVNTALGGSGATLARATSIDAALLVSPTGVLATDVATVAGEIVTSPSGVLETDVLYVKSLVNGSATNVQEGLNSLATALVNSTSFSSSLSNHVTNISINLDNGLSSLPNSSTYAVIGAAAASDGSGGINIVVSSGLGAGNGTYNLSAAALSGGISNGSTFTLTNGANNIVLINRSGSTINTQSRAISYLASMYPVSSQLAMGVSDKVTNSINRLIGGTASSVRARIARVDAALLETPTGVIANDLATVASLIVASPSSSLGNDVQAINSLLNGTSSGSTVETRIGSPTVNASASNLASIIGGPAINLAEQLGNPVTGIGGLSSLVNANTATNNASVWGGSVVDNVANATDLYSQLNQFLALFDTANWADTGHTSITFTCNGAAPTSLADLINKVSSTS